MFNIKHKILRPALFATVILIYSCGSVNRFTSVKKIPREYSLNYCIDGVKAPKTDLNKEPWIVYSDREKNYTTNNPGGKVKSKDIDFLDAFLVIGQKGKYDYLELIKYTPEILKNGKLDYKNAEYYGWIHKSKLLLEGQSVTDIVTGKKNKVLTIFSDTLSINEPEKYFANDSIFLYKDLKAQSKVATVAPYTIVYWLKESEDKTKVLIAKQPYLKADNIKDIILGWVDKSLIQNIGTALHLNLKTVPQDSIQFLLNKKDSLSLTEDVLDLSQMLISQYKTIKYAPVSSYSVKDPSIAFKTRISLPILDYSNNQIFNVDGNSISHNKFRSIDKGLKKLNICFVFEGSDQIVSQFPQVVNALQNLQPLFDKQDDGYNYQFSSVMTFDDTGKLLRPLVFDFTSDYSKLINFLSDNAAKKDKLQAIKLSRSPWSALNKAVASFDNYKDETNLIVLIGDKSTINSGLDKTLKQKIKQNNCRIVGFQVYAGDGDEYNNFVLDVEEMVNTYADAMIKQKREILVSPEQIKRTNHYKQIGDENNYRLDFPDNSITQGGIFFPHKKESLSMEILTHNVDTIISQIKEDNNSITQYMSKAFRSVGNNRTLFDSLFVQNYRIDSLRTPNKKFISSFIKNTPGWYMPSKTVILNDSINKNVEYYLMLSESELKDLKDFVQSLSEYEVDLIHQQLTKQELQSVKPCNCPEDDLFKELENTSIEDNPTDSIIGKNTFYTRAILTTSYANTKQIRKHLTESILNPIQYCKLCKEKGNELKNLTLAEAQYRIAGSPTSNPLLNTIRIKDLMNKKKVTDGQLDELVLYYKKMKQELDKAEQFESNGEVYYWVDRKLLP